MLFLMFLGAVGVKAQVRIGGNTAPNAAAALDLNATDGTNNGTKGLALPRVNLTSNTMQLTSGVVNLTGMLVYNTTATLGAIGIYFWNGATWVRASLPSTSAADSGKFLRSNGTGWYLSSLGLVADTTTRSFRLKSPQLPVSWTVVLDTNITIRLRSNTWVTPSVPGLLITDVCLPSYANSQWSVHSGNSTIFIWTNELLDVTATGNVRCYRPLF